MKFIKKSLIWVYILCLIFCCARPVLALDLIPSFSSMHQSASGDGMDVLKIVKYHVENEYVEKNLDAKKLQYGAIQGYLEALDDPYTRFMEPKSTEEMRTRLAGTFFGIGIQIGVKNKQLTVIAPINGTPAARAGIRSLDTIVTIDGVATKEMSLTEAVSKIRGERGTSVTLGIKREHVAQLLSFTLRRDKIDMAAVDKKEVLKNKVGYIRLTTFENRNATDEMVNAVRELLNKKVSGLIIDLRFNGGGLLQNAIEIANLFLPTKAVIVQTVDREKHKTLAYSTGYPLYPSDMPLVILINEGSASASEIVAGALQDNKRATIVGMRSFGKASVQRIFNLPDGSSILFTTAKYLTPNSTDINKKGITPDIEAKISSEDLKLMQKSEFEYSYDTDSQLQQAIKVINSK